MMDTVELFFFLVNGKSLEVLWLKSLFNQIASDEKSLSQSKVVLTKLIIFRCRRINFSNLAEPFLNGFHSFIKLKLLGPSWQSLIYKVVRQIYKTKNCFKQTKPKAFMAVLRLATQLKTFSRFSEALRESNYRRHINIIDISSNWNALPTNY